VADCCVDGAELLNEYQLLRKTFRVEFKKSCHHDGQDGELRKRLWNILGLALPVLSANIF
jgi:hypothetical protein